jgi:hypothetical protein
VGAGLLEVARGRADATWTADSEPVVTGSFQVEEVTESGRSLDLEIHPAWAKRPLTARLLLPLRRGRRFLQCPRCEKRFLRLYLPQGGTEVACRRCHGLVHRSAQRHDARIDLARRDPTGFLESRSGLESLRSRLVTWRLMHDALVAKAAPRRGRGWGVKSTTSYTRAVRELLAEAGFGMNPVEERDPGTVRR